MEARTQALLIWTRGEPSFMKSTLQEKVVAVVVAHRVVM